MVFAAGCSELDVVEVVLWTDMKHPALHQDFSYLLEAAAAAAGPTVDCQWSAVVDGSSRTAFWRMWRPRLKVQFKKIRALYMLRRNKCVSTVTRKHKAAIPAVNMKLCSATAVQCSIVLEVHHNDPPGPTSDELTDENGIQ
ncbi:uncharacterized protein V6R79_024594 [Siganus canaliculatus]